MNIKHSRFVALVLTVSILLPIGVLNSVSVRAESDNQGETVLSEEPANTQANSNEINEITLSNGNQIQNFGGAGDEPESVFQYTVTIDNVSVNGRNVSIDGTGSADPYVGACSHINDMHDVQVNWGDGTVDNTSDHNFIDPDGCGPHSQRTFSGIWSNEHTYVEAGTYTITAILYHGHNPGNESSEPVTREVTVGGSGTCYADVDENGIVNRLDLDIVIDNWSNPPGNGNDPRADINSDGTVDVNDLLAVINYWGPCPKPLSGSQNGPGGDSDLSVHVYKYLNESLATASTSHEFLFPMTAQWMEGTSALDYFLGNNHGGASLQYEALLDFSSSVTNFSTNETIDGVSIYPAGSTCHSEFCEGDIDQDGYVGRSDIGIVIDTWTDESIPPGATGDINGDGITNVDDLLAVINAWGDCPLGSPCPADLNGDHTVNQIDLNIVIALWDDGSNPNGLSGDVNHDGVVNVDDLLIVINNWGPCPQKYKLLGYSVGDSLSEAESAIPTIEAPTFDVNSNKYVIVWNETCPIAQPQNTAPVLTLLGDNPMNITKDSSFSDPGATAVDLEDGNLTSSITVTGSVNAGVVGSYSLTYSVTDSGGLSDSENRTVNVVEGSTPPQNNNNSSGGGGGGSFFSPGLGSQGEVLGAATCSPYLHEFIKPNQNNNSEEVKKLQTFLNKHFHLNIPSTGVYDSETQEAVARFQSEYNQIILMPWFRIGLHPNGTTPTKYVYKLTRHWINLLKCPANSDKYPELT